MVAKNTDMIRRSPVPIEKKVMMTVWTLSNMEAFRSVGDRFGMNRGSAHRCFIEVCRTIKKSVYPELICWPGTPDEWKFNADKFENLHGFPGCVGCVDGCHVPIKPPSQDRDSYINRKGFASVNMMAICDHTQKFLYCYAQRAGSVHDARVFRVSQVGEKALRNQLFASQDFHLLEDSAYPLLPQVWPMVFY